jgi:hypothetical protein
MLGFNRLSDTARRLEEACIAGAVDARLLAEGRRDLNDAMETLARWRDRLEPH